MNQPTLSIYRISPQIKLPTLATQNAACFDVRFQIGDTKGYTVFDDRNNQSTREFADNKAVIMPRERVLLPTGLIFDIPEGYSIRMHIRSSVALKKGLFLANAEGVIDSDYIHQSYIILYNGTEVKQFIEDGERLMQGELVKNCEFFVKEISKAPVQKTDRTGGLGSTGTA